MDHLDNYRRLIQDLLREYGEAKPATGDVALETLFDREQDRYQLMTVGWDKLHRLHGSVLHVDIRGGKIWIQHDGTEGGIANRLVALGVPKDDIVLAFHPPYKRPYTGFAAA